PQTPVDRDTIPKIFLGGVDRFGRTALMAKRAGAWTPITHAEAEASVARLAAALETAGVGPGDRVALLSENRPEWTLVDYAVTGMGAADVPLYPTLPANQIAYILKDSGAKAIFVSDRAQLAKVLEIRGELPELRQVIAFDDPGGAADVQTMADVLEAGRVAIHEGRAAPFRERALAVKRDDVATLIYTSGTTGNPKGVMLTHFNLASNVAAAQQHDVLRPRPDDVALSFLPLSHVFERMVDYWYWDVGITIAYAESMDKVVDNLMEVRPTVAVSVPRLYEKIYSRVVGGSGLKGRIAHWAVGVGGRLLDARMGGKPAGGVLGAQYRLADRLVFSKLRARTGGRLHTFISGGAPLAPEIARFFFAAGLPVYEGYGLTESSPVIAVNKPDAVRLGTVGTVFPGVQVRIAADGEILTRGPHVMKGYWNNPDATAQALDAEGWLHTGDVGELDGDGFLKITDRIKNILVTAGGKNVAPAPIENVAVMSPYVAQVVMIGDRRAFPSLLVVPDYENLLPWARENGIATTDHAELARDPRVQTLLEQETIGRLTGLARYEMPKKVGVIANEFTIDDGSLTPTLKVKRRVVEERYKDLIESLYAGHAVAD
ncbi:MAG TPA: long-chain fatty acid--CoA ligase, partial [Longimicrobiaceae bacterium]|nr:long-chain fatty acid--CoA ligase [Longimicrobiaceae bacterium]